MALLPPVFDLPLAAYFAVGLLLVGGIASLPPLVGRAYDRLAPRLAHRLLPLLAVERARRVRETAAVAVSGVVAALSLAVALTVMVASFRDSVEYVTCLALVCAVGLQPASAAAAMRAGISGIAQLPWVDDSLEPIVGARVPSVAEDLHGRARLIEMLVQVLSDSSAALADRVDLSALPILLCTSEPERPGPRIGGIVPEVEERLGFLLQRKGTAHVARGHVASIEALGLAERAMDQAGHDECLIVAADSLADPRCLVWLEQAGRLKTKRRSDGVIPGEGAAVLLVSRQPMSPARLAFHGVGTGHETATVLNDEPQLGMGMTTAVAAALAQAGLPMHEVAFRSSDVAGEAYAFEDLVLAQSRLMQRTRPTQDLWHPASSVGDCGAASGIMQLAWIEQAFARGYAPGPIALVHTSSAGGARAAAIVSGQLNGDPHVA
jgi:3-oxoacyl-[acyl-carrier-protein] synthase-1